MKRKTRKSAYCTHFKSFAFLSDCMVTNLTAISHTLRYSENFICTIWHKHRAHSMSSRISHSLVEHVFVSVRTMRIEFAVIPPETKRYIMFLCVFFFSFSYEISVKYIHFSSNVPYSAYTSYFIRLIHSIGRFACLFSYIWERTNFFFNKVTQLI